MQAALTAVYVVCHIAMCHCCVRVMATAHYAVASMLLDELKLSFCLAPTHDTMHKACISCSPYDFLPRSSLLEACNMLGPWHMSATRYNSSSLASLEILRFDLRQSIVDR